MSLLLALLKEAHSIYERMEQIRLGDNPLGKLASTYGLNQKAPLLKNLYKMHLELMTKGAITPAECEEALATDILKLQHPNQSLAAVPTTIPAVVAITDPVTHSSPAEEIKAEPTTKKKLEIILDILQACANLHLEKIKADVAAAQIEKLTPLFNTAFAGIDGIDYFMLQVNAFIRVAPDLLAIKVMKERFVTTEIECGNKNDKILALESALKTANENLTKLQNKNAELVKIQHQYDVDIILLKSSLATSGTQIMPVAEYKSSLDTTIKLRDALRVEESKYRSLEKQYQSDLEKLTKELQDERKKTGAMEKLLASPITKSSPVIKPSSFPLTGLSRGFGSGNSAFSFSKSTTSQGLNGANMSPTTSPVNDNTSPPSVFNNTFNRGQHDK